jgi:hypothetical protein
MILQYFALAAGQQARDVVSAHGKTLDPNYTTFLEKENKVL